MIHNIPTEFHVAQHEDGMRLDAVLAIAFPSLGLRARRRLWDWCSVTVEGIPRPCGFAVKAHHLVRVAPLTDSPQKVCPPQHGGPAPAAASIRLIAHSRDYYALSKPAGLNSAHISGGNEISLEGLLPELWPQMGNGFPFPHCLLTRLDRGTSGIILAARSLEAASRFRLWEQEGQVHKKYCAVVASQQGIPFLPLTIRTALDTANRNKTLVLEREAPPARWTHMTPLAPVVRVVRAERANSADQNPLLGPNSVAASHAVNTKDLPLLPLIQASMAPGQANTLVASFTPSASSVFFLVKACIQRGARHQIRAHLAAVGCPLWQDSLYGSVCQAPHQNSPHNLWPGYLLHHATLTMPEFSVSLPPETAGWHEWRPE